MIGLLMTFKSLVFHKISSQASTQLEFAWMQMDTRGPSVILELSCRLILPPAISFVTSHMALRTVSLTGFNFYGINTEQIRSKWSINLLLVQALLRLPPFSKLSMKLAICAVLVPKAI